MPDKLFLIGIYMPTATSNLYHTHVSNFF